MYYILICVLTLNLTLYYVSVMLEYSSLALEICLQKIVYIESLVTTKKSQEPSILFSSVVFWKVSDVYIYHEVTSNGQPHNLTSDNLEQYQRTLNTNRIEGHSSWIS